ncbi:MAG: hypothetical protein BRC41_19545 [Cyanobacteria bacterium QH_9_48_43]|nr:MAG: hypothetical protein BRC41_19545 [Cyanobacteria bacterium QH_9_48_43]
MLDVGCDTGRFGEALQLNKDCVVDGIEPHLPSAEIAQTRLRNVFTTPIENCRSFTNYNNYDALLSLDVLEHLQNPWSVLEELSQFLNPGGKIFVVVPNIAHVAIVRRLIRGQFEYSDRGTMNRTHLRWFTRNSLQKALSEAGYEKIEIKVSPHIPYLSGNYLLLRKLKICLTHTFPDQLGGSIICIGTKISKH